jgi:hypothetical protein
MRISRFIAIICKDVKVGVIEDEQGCGGAVPLSAQHMLYATHLYSHVSN